VRELVPDLMLLFDGYRSTYGTYSTDLVDQGGGKMKGIASTVKGEVTVELWTKHLVGKQALGIIPIDETSRVKFAAIDIDEYPLDLQKLNADIQRLKLPLVLCRTKSGGAHLYVFLETFHDAAVVTKKMRDIAATLGYGNAEIFPKQTKLIAERGDVGSWINMPYFNSANTDRYALDDTGKPLNFTEFMVYARSKICTPNELANNKASTAELLPGGPPCLNHLCSMGFPAGTRNNGLFNIGVYAQKVHAEHWEQYLHKYNLEFMNPPLDTSEVMGVIKSLKKKEFSYTCKQVPVSNYCNMPKCRQCKHGIGGSDMGMPKFGSLTKILSDPPVWFLEVESGGRLELSTDDLQSARNFQNRCMALLNVMPIIPKPQDWQEIIHNLLKEVTEVPIPFEATVKGQVWHNLEDFLTGRVQAKVVDDLAFGKPYYHNGFYYFRHRDFLDYLDRKKWRGCPPHSIAVYFNEWGFEKKFWNVKGKGINTYVVGDDKFNKIAGKMDVPAIPSPEKALS